MRDSDSSKNWWEEDSADPQYACYKIGDTEVFVGPSPDSDGITPSLFAKIDAWLSVNDTFLKYPDNTRHYWFPWPVDKEPSELTLFGSLRVLHYWIDELKLKRIYIHCLHGLLRAPTVFSCYLYAYHRKNMDDIIKNVDVHGYQGQYSSPLRCFKSYIQTSPRLPFFLEAVAKSGQSSYLDGIKTPLLSNIRISTLEKKLKLQIWLGWASFRIKRLWNTFLNLFKENKIILDPDWKIEWVSLARIMEVFPDHVTVDVYGQAEIKVNKKNIVLDAEVRPNQLIQISFLRHKNSGEEQVRIRSI